MEEIKDKTPATEYLAILGRYIARVSPEDGGIKENLDKIVTLVAETAAERDELKKERDELSNENVMLLTGTTLFKDRIDALESEVSRLKEENEKNVCVCKDPKWVKTPAENFNLIVKERNDYKSQKTALLEALKKTNENAWNNLWFHHNLMTKAIKQVEG